ncbi:FAD-dependent monooxygenase [Pollutimonas harenae]|uniref:FAD-dependent monooxygenase n=1 Tax=Pollutimonas harenae TaxID=657015 RepID=A0A853GXU9_9BURK|nr:FAD-dependent monooxygenase [Pollutimonas harenae]NYT84952.1 FAD-dependent monooxygenase [Pollutimonas harenae]TEA72656.1 ubiquinone biosynthesis protein UbiH [Pollutimonas harenae]
MSKESVLVCGSGIAGLAMALGLAKAGFHAELLGPRSTHRVPANDVYHPRVYAISSSSQAFLDGLGIWSMMDASRVTPVETMEVYGDASGVVHLHAWQAAQTALAWIVESSELERALQQAVQVFGIAWHVEKFQKLESRKVHTESGRVLTPDLLVGADGAKSAVRSAAGISHQSRAYGDQGLVVHLNSELPHQNVALQWFTGDTVLALLPMPDTTEGHQVSMVWSMPDDMAKTLMALPETERNHQLERRLLAVSGGRLGRLTVRSPLFGFPLFLESSAMVAPGVALVSDAAHRVHPLAGQGLNLGLGDVQGLLNVLMAKEAYRAVGDTRVLHRYRRARAEPILAMSLATDGLHKIFANSTAPVAWGRNVGMRVVDNIPLLKRMLIGGAGR